MFEPDDVIDPATLPAKVEDLETYAWWVMRISDGTVNPLDAMLDLFEQHLFDMHAAGVLTLDAVHEQLATARSLATAARDLAE